MKLVAIVYIFFVSMSSFAECEHNAHDSNGKSTSGTKTPFGGCSYFSPILRVGYSSEYSGYIGIGGILPLDQSSDWEGGFSDKGIAFVASKYEDGEIYDLGYANRNGWAIFATGWDLGLSYLNAAEDMYGVYFSYSLIGSVTLRYLESKNEEKFSVDVGLKF